MCSTKLKFSHLISLIVLLIITVSHSVFANEVFTPINTNEISVILNERLFFATSEHGFIHNNSTGSPLQNEIPDEISMSKHQRTQSANTVLVQTIDTSAQDFQTLEGGLPGGALAWLIAGGILGYIIAPFFRQEKHVGWFAIIGAFALMMLASSIFESGDFRLYVDNATDMDILLEIDSFSPIAISAHSDIGVKFKEGIKHIKTVKASDMSELDQFDLQATKYQNESGYYIYNVAAKNKYTIHHVVYTPTQ